MWAEACEERRAEDRERVCVGKRAVVHAYGHAGAGYQNSVGSARAVVELVGESIACRPFELASIVPKGREIVPTDTHGSDHTLCTQGLSAI